MKRLLTIQDISCVGKCSLTVALPVISSMGVECAVLPTAVLSAHTAFKRFTSVDLTHTLRPAMDSWDAEGITFDGIYSGYLATPEQLSVVSEIKDRFCKDSPLLVDPVMGDFGRLYTGFSPDFPLAMRDLCNKANVIVPNLTEACALTGEKYREDFTTEKLRDIAKALCDKGTKAAVITGYSSKENEIGVLKYDSIDGTFFTYTAEKALLDHPLHGTGDIFASVVAGALMSGESLDNALGTAVDFVAECVRETSKDPTARWYGVSFENLLHRLKR